jgi:hypothetical protein
MSLAIDEINGLLNIVKEAAGHPQKLGSLGALAMKALESHNAAAKKEHDKILADEAKQVAAKRQDELNKQAAQAVKDNKSAELTLKPQEPPKPIARPATEFKPEHKEEPEADDYSSTAEPVQRRNVTEEVANG